MNHTYLIVAGLCLTGLIIRDVYELLKQAGRLDSKNKAIFAAVVVAMGAMLLSWPVMCPLDPWRIAIPGAVSWTGLGMIAVAAVLAVGALIQLRGVENIDHLVTTGLFSRLRHPMYAGFILWIAGWILRYGALASLIPAVACASSILWWKHLEERALEAEYGEEYRRFHQRTWF
jgi:protein-S-isoprenylcysteine O-methyltransferase Ste14